MFHLAIGSDDGLIYGGARGMLLHRLTPYPMLLPLYFEASSNMRETADIRDAPGRLFLEDSFDPITRIRRGRIYCRETGGQPAQRYIEAPHSDLGSVEKRAYTYQRESLHQLKEIHGGRLPKVLLGGGSFQSLWKILSIEQDANDTFVLILKSYRSLGELPELDFDHIPKPLHKRLTERVEHVENAIHRATPNDIVDRCRDVLSLVFGELCGAPEKDLGAAIRAYSELPEGLNKHLLLGGSDMVRRLHARGKPNEEKRFKSRPLEEEDGQLAVRCLGLALREIGWAC